MARDLLVPGTGGTKLLLDGDDIGWPSELSVGGWIAKIPFLSTGFQALGAKFGTPEAITAVLSMQHSDDPDEIVPLKTTLAPGGEVTPGPELKLAYNQFDGFDVFTYDWRQDIRRSGERLLQKLTATPGERWRIVAHSQGGLVVVAAARKLAAAHGDDDRAFAKLVSHVAFLGSPLHGTMSAADAFMRGEDLAAPFSDGFRRIVRTWPAIYQMMPTWLGCVRTATAAGGETVEQSNLLDDAPWAGQAMVPSMLERARRTRKDCFRSPLAFMNGVSKRILQSRAHSTWDHALRRGGTMQAAGDVRGDTLVPDDLTRTMGNAIQRDVTQSVGHDNDTMIHFALATDPTLCTLVKDFFKQ